MLRVLGLLVVLIALLIVGVLSKKQITAVHSAGNPASIAAEGGQPVAPEVNTPEQGRQLQKQIRDDLDRISQDRTKQIDQGVDGGKP
jgi:hypothetical protein